MRCLVTGAGALAAFAMSAPTVAADGDDRQVCRQVEAATGSRLGGRRVCRTAAEWRAIEQQAQREFDRGRSGPNLPPPVRAGN